MKYVFKFAFLQQLKKFLTPIVPVSRCGRWKAAILCWDLQIAKGGLQTNLLIDNTNSRTVMVKINVLNGL